MKITFKTWLAITTAMVIGIALGSFLDLMLRPISTLAVMYLYY